MKKQVKSKWYLLLVLLMVGLLIVGCSDVPTDTPSTDTQPDDTASGESEELLIAVTQANNTFDPWAPTNAYDNVGRMQVFDTLVFKNNKGEIIPSLAKSYEFSDDAMSATFYLNEGVKFHNGDEMKASDVKFSIEQAMAAAVSQAYMSNIESVEVVDDYTVKVNLKTPNVALLEILMTYGQVVNEEVYSAAGMEAGSKLENIVGTGPYVLKEWTPDQLCYFEANEDYFKGAPAIKNARIKAITDPNAAIIALQTGEVDLYMATVPAIAVDSIKSDSNLTVTDITSRRLYYLGMNCEFGPFVDNDKLRQAVAYGVDREGLSTIATQGLGTLVYYPGGPDYVGQPNVADSGYKHDVEKAKALVKEAGAEGLEFTISLENSSNLPELATALQGQLAEIGLDAKVSILEVNAYLKDVYAEGNYDMFISFTTAKTKDMDTVWTQLFHSQNVGQGNSARYRNSEMDQLIEAARAEADPAARKSIYADAVEVFQQDIPLLALFYEYSCRAYTNDLAIDPPMAEYDNIYYYSWK